MYSYQYLDDWLDYVEGGYDLKIGKYTRPFLIPFFYLTQLTWVNNNHTIFDLVVQMKIVRFYLILIIRFVNVIY